MGKENQQSINVVRPISHSDGLSVIPLTASESCARLAIVRRRKYEERREQSPSACRWESSDIFEDTLTLKLTALRALRNIMHLIEFELVGFKLSDASIPIRS